MRLHRNVIATVVSVLLALPLFRFELVPAFAASSAHSYIQTYSSVSSDAPGAVDKQDGKDATDRPDAPGAVDQKDAKDAVKSRKAAKHIPVIKKQGNTSSQATSKKPLKPWSRKAAKHIPVIKKQGNTSSQATSKKPLKPWSRKAAKHIPVIKKQGNTSSQATSKNKPLKTWNGTKSSRSSSSK